jgi:hypothetical protein
MRQKLIWREIAEKCGVIFRFVHSLYIRSTDLKSWNLIRSTRLCENSSRAWRRKYLYLESIEGEFEKHGTVVEEPCGERGNASVTIDYVSRMEWKRHGK